MIREFRLSAPGSGHGVSCDANGAFVSGVSLLKRSGALGGDRWEPRDCEDLSEQLGLEFGLPIDVSGKAGGLKAICNALNECDVVRAQIAAVLLGIPEPPNLAKSAHSDSDMIEFIRDLHWSGLIKADWDPDKHPRWPAGAAESQGGQFAPKSDFGFNDDEETQIAANDLPRRNSAAIRRAWEQLHGQSWPVDPKNGGNQDAAHMRARGDGGSDKPNNIKPQPHDEHVQEHKDNGDFRRWGQRRGPQDPRPPTSAPKPKPILKEPIEPKLELPEIPFEVE